ncbi:unnamed protein product [Ilex paraguariensis]|uniref:OCEL domain-containing protein n=1 Tax=Ilex paraguariensis TaxID=185542 RepID=A0ABC8T7E5_9AQUA
MNGGSGKFGRSGGGGRGGGGGPGKRNSHSNFHPPPLHRPSATSDGGRLSMGGAAGPRNRTTTSGPTTSAPPTSEENFSLVTDNPLNFAMIIRLAPDLVEEIKHVEAQGGTARIKFDANANNPSGNVIDVGGKDFRFTWSRETGDLCDIYEERQSGEDGNGLLVESGCPWRKLNVHRILDESTKNHVKMRSEEAERKLKSRKAIVLEPGNPSMKSQMKALAAAEANPWRMPFKQKKDPPFKKQKTEPPLVGGPPKSVYKSGLSSTTPSKGRPSASPVPCLPEQSGASASPFGSGNLTKGHANVEDAMPTQAMTKEHATISEKEMSSRLGSGVVWDKPKCKGNVGAKPMDLQSVLISLLTENPKGMSLKALEKAIGDIIPNSVRQIEPIIKKIATFQAPGRYFLKPEVELESFKKPLSESGSSPEDALHQSPAPEDNCDQLPASEPIFSMKDNTKELEEQAQLNSKPAEESNAAEKIDISHHSLEGPAGSSSDSGSDSDSDSHSSASGSDSGSHSRSRSRSKSKSRSPIGSLSGSSSDSESDASSNSKEGSDEDVDIMTSDDDKESKHKLQTSEPGLSTSPIPWRTPDGEPVHNGIYENHDGHGSDIVEIEKDLPDDEHEAEMAVVINSAPNKEGEKPLEETKPSSPDRLEYQKNQVRRGNFNREKETMARADFKDEQPESFEKVSKGKSKRVPSGKHFDNNMERAKRSKNLAQPQFSGGRNPLLTLSPHNLSHESPVEGPYKVPTTHMMMNIPVRDGTDFDLHKGYNQAIPGKSVSGSQHSGRRSVDLSTRADPPAAADRPGKHAERLGRSTKHSERSLEMHEGFPTQKNEVNREAQVEDGHIQKKLQSGVRDRHLTSADSQYRKQGELVGNFKEAGLVSNSNTRFSPNDSNKTGMDRSGVTNGRGSILQRELSDLELGEFREPFPEETPGMKMRFERKGSFKQSENKQATSNYRNSDLGEGKPAGKTTADSRKPSPPHSNIGIASNAEDLSKKRTPEHYVEEFARSYHGVEQPQHLSRIDHSEVGTLSNKLADVNGKNRHNEVGGIGPAEYEDTHKKVPVSAPLQNDSRRGAVSPSTKGSKKQKCSTLADFTEVQRDASLTERNDNGRKRRESSSDENSCTYSKYEKEGPELKGPIKNFSQYKEYVQEYHEKYDSYCSLNKILESYRNEFNKLGRELEIAKGRDAERYYSILEQLRDSYRQCGMVVLYFLFL